MSSKKQNRRKHFLAWSLILAVALLIVAIRLVEDIGPERGPDHRFIITRVLDGDSVELPGGDRLRLLAIDTPERGEPFYNEAIAFLDSLALGKTARITYGNRRRDTYGRLLGYLYIDSLFINKLILENGLGNLYLFRDNDLASGQVRQLLEAQQRAMAAKIGIWAIERKPESRYIARQNSFRLHRPDCRSVENLKPGTYREFPDRNEGLSTGLSPCRNCRP